VQKEEWEEGVVKLGGFSSVSTFYSSTTSTRSDELTLAACVISTD
jgi:hypothetical protein